jgi:hypothetical protein
LIKKICKGSLSDTRDHSSIINSTDAVLHQDQVTESQSATLPTDAVPATAPDQTFQDENDLDENRPLTDDEVSQLKKILSHATVIGGRIYLRSCNCKLASGKICGRNAKAKEDDSCPFLSDRGFTDEERKHSVYGNTKKTSLRFEFMTNVEA